MMRRSILMMAMLVVAASADFSAQSGSRIVGTWRLVAVSSVDASGGDRREPFGPNPTGRLVYTPEGTVAVVISYSGRKPLSADRAAARVEERAEAFSTSLAYAGRYSLAGNQVTHHVEVSSVENWVKTDLVRVLTADGNRITLRTPPTSVGGTSRTTDLVWERVK